MNFTVKSTSFHEGGMIPEKHAYRSANKSPGLSWENPPPGTKSFALICDDPDAPAGDWVHWVICNIPPGAGGLKEDLGNSVSLPDGSCQGRNDFGAYGYGGPSPPRGTTHRYCFKLYALDRTVAVSPDLTKNTLLNLMKGHVLGKAELHARYSSR